MKNFMKFGDETPRMRKNTISPLCVHFMRFTQRSLKSSSTFRNKPYHIKCH